MRSASWIQISDFHLREKQAWAQDVVLASMCESIEAHCKQNGGIDFILATGDLAFSGRDSEYGHVAAFFDQVLSVSNVPKERLFCIPGNHDVDRSVQKLAFTGARHALKSQNEIDELLGDLDELSNLRARQSRYHHFQESYLGEQVRKWTPDRLAYVSTIEIDRLRLSIIGLNSAWLSEGGNSDHGKLLIGERQVIDAINIATENRPHLIISMAHHPFHILNDFDRRPVQRRIEEACQFFHCGHLHDPETRTSSRASMQCHTIAAGASFETRHAHNSYSIVSLNPMDATLSVRTMQFRPTDGKFRYASTEDFPFALNSSTPCTIKALAGAITELDSTLANVAHYLAALLLEAQTEVPISAGSQYAFGSVDLQNEVSNKDIRIATRNFLAVRNPLKLLGAEMPLGELIAKYSNEVNAFAGMLQSLSSSHPNIRSSINAHEADARALAGAEPLNSFSHTIALLDDLAREGEWQMLREHAERHLNGDDHVIAVEAKRKLGLSLAHSGEPSDRTRAEELYRSLLEGEDAQNSDYAALAAILVGNKAYDEAKEILIRGVEQHPDSIASYMAVGQSIVEATGDRDFRKRLQSSAQGGSRQ